MRGDWMDEARRFEHLDKAVMAKLENDMSPSDQQGGVSREATLSATARARMKRLRRRWAMGKATMAEMRECAALERKAALAKAQGL